MTTDSTAGGLPDTGARGPRPPMLLIYAITLTGITVNTLVAPGLPDILDAFGAPRGLAGVVLAAATMPGIVLAPVVGVLADRYGRREVLAPCLALFGVAGGLATFAPALWVLVVLRFLQGAGSAGLINLATVLIGDHWEGAERARMIGRNAAVLTVAVALFPALGGGLTDLGGWRAPFLVYPLSLVTALVVLRRLPRSPRRTGRVRDQLAEAAPSLRSPGFVGALVSAVLVFAILFGLVHTVLPIYLEAGFGLPAGPRGVIIGLPAAAAAATSLSLGRLYVRFSRRHLLVVGCLVLAASLTSVAAAPVLGLLIAGVFVFGFGEGLIIPTLQEYTTRIGGASSRGTVVAVWVGGARLGQTGGPLAGGGGVATVGAEASFLVGAVVAVGLAVLLGVGGRRFSGSSPGGR